MPSSPYTRREFDNGHGHEDCDGSGGDVCARDRGAQRARVGRQAHYDYDYYGYGDYRGGYNEPFYRYDEFYFDYAGPPQPSAVRQPPNRAQPDDELGLGPDSLYYDVTGGVQVQVLGGRPPRTRS
ncbi:hypothetical protein EVAR_60396_1 [Eumeta japonica]|uniref:Uncharacterized protein n=1 Tax=Eumeta variegata TaxID=151549 RepID=A0A4C1YS72_EUMVA|nr:hypothetical protein EVAR_60396_1 [Eumeta japonica]